MISPCRPLIPPHENSHRPAEPRWDDLAFAVRERSGTYSPYYIRSVLELAKKWTGDDWDRIENQRSDRAKDRALVEPMMNEFSKRFHMTISVEGEDCETERDAWWIRYWYSIGTAFAEYPPMAGSLDVTLQVTAAARDITVEVDETGSKFVFTAPRDIEPKDWSEKLEKPFRRHAKKL